MLSNVLWEFLQEFCKILFHVEQIWCDPDDPWVVLLFLFPEYWLHAEVCWRSADKLYIDLSLVLKLLHQDKIVPTSEEIWRIALVFSPKTPLCFTWRKHLHIVIFISRYPARQNNGVFLHIVWQEWVNVFDGWLGKCGFRESFSIPMLTRRKTVLLVVFF